MWIFYFSKSSGAASAILRVMLNDPQKQWQVITLAQESGKALGTVSNVKSFYVTGILNDPPKMVYCSTKSKFPGKYDSSIEEAQKCLDNLLKEGKVK